MAVALLSCMGAALVALGGGEALSAEELVRRLAAAQEAQKRPCYTKSETHTTRANDYSRSPTVRNATGQMEMRYVTEVSCDGQRCAVATQRWGRGLDGRPIYSAGKPASLFCVWDGSRCASYSAVGDAPGALRVTESPRSPDRTILMAGTEATLRGYYSGSGAPIEEVLTSATSLRRRTGTEVVGGSPCHVLEAETPYGKHVLWIDPAHGWNVARAEVLKKPGDWINMDNRPMSKDLRVLTVLEIKRFEKIQDLWVAIEAEERSEMADRGGISKSVTRHKRTAVEFDPDFEARRAFTLDRVSNGAKVFLKEKGDDPSAPMSRRMWQDGRIVSAPPAMPRGVSAVQGQSAR